MSKNGYRVSVQIMSHGEECELLDKVFYVESLDKLSNDEQLGYRLAEQAREFETDEGLEPIGEYDETEEQ